MNAFDRRWHQCVRKAREAPSPPWPSPPQPVEGWLAARSGTEADSDRGELQEWWSWYGARGLAAATVVLVACLVLVARDRPLSPALRPGVEDAVAEVLWRL